MPFPSIGGGNIDIFLADKICTIIKFLYSPQERLTTNVTVPPVMSVFVAFAKKPEPESSIWRLSAKAEGKRFKELTEGFRSDSVDTRIIASGNEADNGQWVTEDMC
jgi:hypothetical protein